ncbi:MAG: hypothetical protein AAF492_13640, partial [Verrucomicrobiota bacterium]
MLIANSYGLVMGDLPIPPMNLVAGSPRGIEIRTSSNIMVQANYLGTDFTGEKFLQAHHTGIILSNAAACDIGADNVLDELRFGNLIATYRSEAIRLENNSRNNRIRGNRIGVSPDGADPFFRSKDIVELSTNGIHLINAASNTIGGTDSSEGNLIVHARESGILIEQPGSVSNRIQGNRIGPVLVNVVSQFVGQVAVRFSLTSNHLVGGSAVIPGEAPGNLMAMQRGVMVDVDAATIQIQGNLIGHFEEIGSNTYTDIGYEEGLDPERGIEIQGTDNLIGGTGFGEGNLIIGHEKHGILFLGTNAIDNQVQGNLIGILPAGAGETNLSFTGNDIGISVIGASDNQIGSEVPGAENIIAENTIGILIASTGRHAEATSPANGNSVSGNIIGEDPVVPGRRGQREQGILLDAGSSGTEIGGPGPDFGNLILGNGAEGILIRASSSNEVQANTIGETNRGNRAEGIQVIDASDNLIGSTLTNEGNTIGFNQGDGILIRTTDKFSRRNSILGNRFVRNGGLAIDLGGNGLDPLDAGDGDGGPNFRQNYPLTLLARRSSGTLVQGEFQSMPNQSYRLEFFSSPGPDFEAEAERFIGHLNVTTDNAGRFDYSNHFPVATPGNHFIAAIATDLAGNSSELSV